MKKLLLFITSLTFLQLGYPQNAPVAVNDTIYVDFNDSISFVSSDVMFNDFDPDGDNIFPDTTYYNGLSFFESNKILPAIMRINYKPPLNYIGIDSALFVIEDNGNPIRYDTSIIYFFVKHQEYELLNLNNINARFGLNTFFRNVPTSVAAFEVPKGSGENTFYVANLWVAGKNQDSVFINGATFAASLISNPLTDFVSRSGPIMDSIYYKEYDYQWDRLWKINNADLVYHQNNWNNAGYQPIDVIVNWPAHGDTAKGQAYYLAPFVDNNNDGVYNPLDGDYPKIKGQQAIYFIYNDLLVSPLETGGLPLKSEVHYMAYAYHCPSDSALYNTIFVDYAVYNRSNLTYDSTYVGLWADLDILPNSEYMGSDVARSTFYAYNDNLNSAISQSVTFLKGAKKDNDGIDNPFTPIIQDVIDSNGTPYADLGTGFGDGIIDNEHWGMEHFMSYSIGSASPQTPLDYYNYLKGFWRDGSQSVWGGNGNAASSGGTIPTKYLFPGTSDPLWCSTEGVVTTPSNWSDITAGNPSGDKRGIGSTGPFTFEPDSSIAITLAFVYGRDYQNTGNQAGIVVMQERIDSIRHYFNTDFVSACNGSAPVSVKKINNSNNLLVYPNPFSSQFNIKYNAKSSSAILEVYNLLGEKIISQAIKQSLTTINLSQQKKGIYFIKVIDGNQFLSQKIVKQ